MQAGTNPQTCVSTQKVRVEAWISGEAIQCQTGSPEGSKCYKENTVGPEQTTATVQIISALDQCGNGDGMSNHTVWNPSQTVQMGRATNLAAPPCDPPPPPPSCEEQCFGDAQCLCQCADYVWHPEYMGQAAYCGPTDPLIISLDKNAKYKLTSIAKGVAFDTDADGVPEYVAWTDPKSDVAFLALDRDGDGRITSGKELFGDHTLPGAKNGFHALELMAAASNGGVARGSVSTEDPIFESLLLWRDANQNGVSEPSELRPASEALSAIGLGYRRSEEEDGQGNKFIFRGWAHLRTAPGKNRPNTAEEDVARTITIWNVALATR
jgi:hypothetical protein